MLLGRGAQRAGAGMQLCVRNCALLSNPKTIGRLPAGIRARTTE